VTTVEELLPSVAELARLRHVAGGSAPADLIVRNGQVLHLHTGEIRHADVVIAGRHIAAITPPGRFGAAANEIEADGRFVAPTFVDTHIHIEYTMLTPGELARLIVPKGTTTLLADPNCIANVLGEAGMDVVAHTGTPLRILQQVSPEVPRSPTMELGGAVVPDAAVHERLQRSNAVALGESNPFNLSLESAAKQRTALAAGKRITGHTARLADEPLWAYAAGGVSDDHNAVTTAEVLDRLRLGMTITVMAGSMNDNCPQVFADLDALGAWGLAHLCFCADDKHVDDLCLQGHIDHHIRQVISAGVAPIDAYRMATLNAAIHARLDHVLGSVTPSRLADLVLLDDLRTAEPSMVLVGGEVAARDGAALFTNDDDIPAFTRHTVKLAPTLTEEHLAVRVAGDDIGSAVVRAVEMYDGYFKRAFEHELAVIDGVVHCDIETDVLQVAIVDRHHATPTVGLGFVRGFGLTRGALAATTNCENQNLVLVGTSASELLHAARVAAEIGGGYVAVADGEVLATCPLPIAGIMSDQPWEEVHRQSIAVDAAAESLGCTMHAPFMIMAFIGLAGVPDLGLTERGLIDVATQQFCDVVVRCCRCPTHVHDLTPQHREIP
jgi:adenine deaminase